MNRLNQVLVLSAGWLALVSGFHGYGQAPKINEPATPTVTSPASDDDRLRANVDTLVQQFQRGDAEPRMAMALARQIEARADLENFPLRGGTGGPTPSTNRAEPVKRLLTPKRYSEVEAACVSLLRSPREEARVLSIHVMAITLGSEAAKPHLAAILHQGATEVGDDSPGKASPLELFSSAEGLAFLGDPRGQDILKSVLAAGDAPPALQQRAIKAMKRLGRVAALEDAPQLLLSDDAYTAYAAFDSIPWPTTNRVALAAAISQVQKARAVHETNKRLSMHQLLLVQHLSSHLKAASRSGLLSGEQILAIRESAKDLAGSPELLVQERAASLLADFAGEENAELLARLLRSPSPNVRSRAALGLAKCSPEQVRPHFDVLAGMLDDEEQSCRNFALYALRTAFGEKAGTVVSSQEFTALKERILRKIKP